MERPDLVGGFSNVQLPFVKTFVVYGQLHSGPHIVENVRTEIQFLEAGEGPVLGAFYGEAEQGKQVFEVLTQPEVQFEGTWSHRNASYSITFTMRGIVFGSFTNRYETDLLCRFRCLQLDVKERFRPPYLKSAEVVSAKFTYAIPRRSEMVVPRLPDFLKAEMEDYKDHLELDSPLGTISISTTTHAPKASWERSDVTILLGEMSLSLSPSPIPKYTESQGLIGEADDLVDSLLVVVSLLLKQDTRFFKRVCEWINREQQIVVSETTYFERTPRGKGFVPISRSVQEMHQLLKEVFPLFTNHQDKDNVREAAVLTLAAFDADYVETKLVLRQSAIEVIINSQWRRLGLLENRCEKCGRRTDHLKNRILEIIGRLNVEASDIYPSIQLETEQTFPFISFRNKIVHGQRHKIADNDKLVEEMMRQEILLYRLLFQWIGLDIRTVPSVSQSGFWLKRL